MKLDYDFIRKLLIHVEEKAPLQGLDSKDLFEFAKSTDKSNNELSYTISKLKEGNLVTANFIYANNTIKIITNVNLTYSGHEYLNTVFVIIRFGKQQKKYLANFLAFHLKC